MGAWSAYFLAKLYLFLSGSIRFDLVANGLFALFLLLPVPAGWRQRRVIVILKEALSLFLAAALLWRDSWLPSPLAAFTHLSAEGIPTGEYMAGFILRYIIHREMLILLGFLAAAILLRRWRFLTPLTLLLLCIAPLLEHLALKGTEPPPAIVREAPAEEVRTLARLDPDREKLAATGQTAAPPVEERENALPPVEAEKGGAPIQPEPLVAAVAERGGAPEPVIKPGSPNDWTPIKEIDPQRYADAFFARETLRRIEFREIPGGEAPFDIVFIHICSLSWDDLDAAGIDWKPFFSGFQLLFTDFNAVTSYSGPAGQRLLKSNCGQLRHLPLYGEVADECFLFPSLSFLGYKDYFAANHDGKYGDYARDLKRYGRLAAPLIPPDKLPLRQRLFDNTPVYDDYAALENWWKIRLADGGERAAAYYNTATLHDGSRRDPDGGGKRSREELYNEFLTKLLKDIDKFFRLLETSGRNVVVVFVPEHGMALRGTRIQVAGLRDIPLPRINVIPVGIKFFGKGFNGAPVRQKVVSKPTSYMAVPSSLAAMFRRSPFGPRPYDPEYLLESIVQTDHVYENEGVIVVRPENHYMVYDKKERWTRLPVQ